MNNPHARQLRQAFRQYSRSQEDSFQEEVEFAKLLPAEGFIAEYMEYTSRQESPGSFHFWVAASIISAILGRRAWVSKGVYELYPNIYVVLVAPSGVARKSRAMRLGTNLIEEYDWVNIIADKTSPEAMLASLDMNIKQDKEGEGAIIQNVTDSQGFVRSGEMSVFLNKTNYTSGMTALLTDLYDCPDHFTYRTRTQRDIELHNVYLTFLGATTPDWLATNTPEEAFEGGFMSRVIFVFKGNRDRNFPFPEEPEQGQVEKLRQMVQEIRTNFMGHVPLSTQATEYFTQYYQQVHAEYTEQNSEKLGGFIERKPDTLLKVALILSAAENPYKRLITVKNMRQAHHLLHLTQAKMFNTFAKVDRSKFGQIQDKILEIMEHKGTIRKRELLRKLGRNVDGVKQLEEAMTILIEAGYVEEGVEATDTKSASVYRLINEQQGLA